MIPAGSLVVLLLLVLVRYDSNKYCNEMKWGLYIEIIGRQKYKIN
jgi:hypothetical protein